MGRINRPVGILQLRVVTFSLVVCLLAWHPECACAQQVQTEPLVTLQADGTLSYAVDEKGDRIPDFSFCGYQAGEQPIPFVEAAVFVPWRAGDATPRIQAAIDYVATLPLGNSGFRGAVLLDKGDFEISGALVITASGIVLRGSGSAPDGTNLLGTGQTRETLITIAGAEINSTGEKVAVSDAYVPVNATQLRLTSGHPFVKGDMVFVHRPSTQAWIDTLGMNEFGGESGWLGWKPGQRDLRWDREIVAVDGDVITLDAPITTALDKEYGGGLVSAYDWTGRIENVGIENLRCTSSYDVDNLKDEQHRWMAITMENAMDAWVRQVTFRHFAGSAVAVFETAKRVTVEDCVSLSPVSEIGGQRRYTFFTMGQQTLFQRLYAEYGYHDFAVGFCAAGPNAFVQCQSHLPHSFSGTIDSWASGVLFDMVSVDGNALGFQNRRHEAQGAGWSAANSVLWQCNAARIDCYRPPTANNYAFGAWAQFAGDGYWWEANSHIEPRSLYYAQLQDRIGKEAARRAHLLPQEGNASSSPTVEQAAALTALSEKPVVQLQEWISHAPRREPLICNPPSGIRTIDQIGFAKHAVAENTVPVDIINGRLVYQGALVSGGRWQVPWWRGDIRPYAREKAKPHITRFVPGRTGRGLTDNIAQVTDDMKRNHIAALEHNYGLWYDRRRDDHERVRRMNGEVWAPFYELPFARSGEGTAWDGLSKYDLTSYNAWYWDRLAHFAEEAEQEGLILMHHHYFQHNILEAGAHYADFPWRTVNNINDTGFPEPVPYAGDKRIFMDEQFYDITHPARRKLHRSYIRKCLENFSDHSNVVHMISEEYTGPLHFVQFWLDVIQEWEKETGKDVTVALSATKDVQDAVLNDRTRNSIVEIVDLRYWHYRQDGSLYAPDGGQHLAPRQHARLVKPGKTSFEQVYRAVLEYRLASPDKAVLYSATGYDDFGWAVFIAGGSLPAIPVVKNDRFLEDASAMVPLPDRNTSSQWVMGDTEKGMIVFSNSTESIHLDLTNSKGTFYRRWIDPENGSVVGEEKKIKGGKEAIFKSPVDRNIVLWLSRE